MLYMCISLFQKVVAFRVLTKCYVICACLCSTDEGWTRLSQRTEVSFRDGYVYTLLKADRTPG